MPPPPPTADFSIAPPALLPSSLRRASCCPTETGDVVCLPLAGAILKRKLARRGGARGVEWFYFFFERKVKRRGKGKEEREIRSLSLDLHHSRFPFFSSSKISLLFLSPREVSFQSRNVKETISFLNPASSAASGEGGGGQRSTRQCAVQAEQRPARFFFSDASIAILMIKKQNRHDDGSRLARGAFIGCFDPIASEG